MPIPLQDFFVARCSWKSLCVGWKYRVTNVDLGRCFVTTIGWVPSYCFFESIYKFLNRCSFKNTCKEFLLNLNHLNLNRYNYCTDKFNLLFEDFIRFNRLDKYVIRRLRTLSNDVLCKIMDYGFFINGQCNSAIVTARIRKFNTD